MWFGSVFKGNNNPFTWCKMENAPKLGGIPWAQQGMILRPPDYESDALTN